MGPNHTLTDVLDAAIRYVTPLGIRATSDDCRISTVPPASVREHEPPFGATTFVETAPPAWFVQVTGRDERDGWHPCVVRVEVGAQGPNAVDVDWL